LSKNILPFSKTISFLIPYKVSQTDIPPFGKITLLGGRVEGKSTDAHMPYVIINDYENKNGFFFALEWPCKWIIQLAVQSNNRGNRILSCVAHVAWTNFDLVPGESVPIAKIDIGFFKGNSFEGSNALRKHIVKHIMRPIKGATLLPPVFYNHWFGGLPDKWNISDLKREADIYSELGIEYFVVDAGWFKGGFRKGIGNWEKVDRKRFPDGMEEMVRYVESKGMKFGSWLEIEFAMENSDWAKRHPDWFYSAETSRNFCCRERRFQDLLLKLDNLSVREKVADFIESWVKRYHIKWIRWDFNNSPAPFWMINEKDNQMGKLQIGYGDGLLKLLDNIMERCPDVHIEACAGGGHRMDLGTLRRAHSAWMNDNTRSFDAVRRFQSGINRLLPGNYGNSCFLLDAYPVTAKLG